jgi:hypothetical protein
MGDLFTRNISYSTYVKNSNTFLEFLYIYLLGSVMSRHGHRTRGGCCPDGTQIVHNMCLTQD